MTYRALPYEYEIEEGKSGLTALGGLPIYLELAAATGLLKAIDSHMRIRTEDQGWSDRQIILALLLLNLAGGDIVNDIERLEGDEGFCRILRKAEHAKNAGRYNIVGEGPHTGIAVGLGLIQISGEFS